METTTGKNLYDLLVTRDFQPEILDAQGKPVSDPEAAELFSFDWKTAEKNYGTVVLLLGKDNELEIYFGDNLGRSMESQDKREWYKFLEQIKNFATRNLLTFEINNINRLKYTMQGMAAIKEGLFEGYYGTRHISYSDQPKKSKLVIKHDRPLGEGDARFRHIDSLYVETEDGNRFRLPFKTLVGGRVMARHCAEGGTPYDAFGQHITQLMSEMATMSRFVRAAKNKNYTGEAAALLDSAIRHYGDLKAKAKRMISRRGYLAELEGFDPAEFRDSEVTAEAIRDVFVEQTLDPRIEQAIPLLARLAERQQVMPEAEIFEQYLDRLEEGTWALPDSPEKQQRLRELMMQPLPVGPDATNATEQLYDLIGDDQLFDILQRLAQQDPDANVWQSPAVAQRMNQLGIDITNDTESVGEDLDSDGVMMTRPSNMSSESIDPVRSFKKLIA